MANTKRKLTNSVGQPTISVRAERTAQSLAAECGAVRRRIMMIGGPGLEPSPMAGARVRPAARVRGGRTVNPSSRAGGIRPGAKPVSRCLGSGEKLVAQRPDRD